MIAPRYFELRLKRGAPLTVARLWFDDCEPGTDNRLDRGNLVPYVRVEIAGHETQPEELLSRLGVRWRGDVTPPPPVIIAALNNPKGLQPRPRDHWASLTPISAGEYEFRTKHLSWARAYRRADPRNFERETVRPSEFPIEGFARERALLEEDS